MEKPQTAWVGPKVWWSRASENHQGWVNSVSLVGGVSDMVSTCQLCGCAGGEIKKETVASVSTSVWKKAGLHDLMWGISVPPHMSLVPFNQLPLCWSSQSVSVHKSVWGPLRGISRDSSSFCIPKPQSLLLFTDRSYGNLSS